MVTTIDIFSASTLQELSAFPAREEQLAILERETPADTAGLFQALMSDSFSVAGKVRKKSAEEDIRRIVEKKVPAEVLENPFYTTWVADMTEVCSAFCDTLNHSALCFWLGSERGCQRYHIDNVPLRALVTYAGKGTEYVPDYAADRVAFSNGAPNEEIVTDSSSICFMDTWDVAIFRGGAKGLLHRTPDAALTGPSILMRLDHESFWDRVLVSAY